MRNIEQASRTSYAPRTFVQLETALQFGDGVVEKILDGTATRSEIDEVVPRGTVTGENWQALAAAVKARRELLRLPQQLIGHDGPGEMTMRKIERAETTA
ncbi:MAG TPA: hypothetical protein VK735_18875, partial [Pseudonocardia sp.]|uniref:hypothetical protein n=1 Tax=Pseudonocardia sp. TaxID=60912 RepID=UPI002C3FB842